ncbi:GNAT family N-acetyltransferase [Flavobacterium sp.]|uniref:GNAT family N-acetyltransferase n=1 Tax=Flavobacterium sp. TaxID=239 RepID=UPI00286DAB3F|nr:GNAT family N-acetyltransferase [Flavobacterium sp.]
MKITEVTKEGLHIIQDLAYRIWPSTYGAILSKVQLDYMLNMFYDIHFLEIQMLQKNQTFLLIEENQEYLGFCAYELNHENSENTKLHKLYVLPKTQGKGVGKLLLQEVEKIALQNNNNTVLLNVNRFNKAQEFYKYLGYQTIETVNIEIGNGYLMEDYVMKKVLK